METFIYSIGLTVCLVVVALAAFFAAATLIYWAVYWHEELTSNQSRRLMRTYHKRLCKIESHLSELKKGLTDEPNN